MFCTAHWQTHPRVQACVCRPALLNILISNHHHRRRRRSARQAGGGERGERMTIVLAHGQRGQDKTSRGKRKTSMVTRGWTLRAVCSLQTKETRGWMSAVRLARTYLLVRLQSAGKVPRVLADPPPPGLERSGESSWKCNAGLSCGKPSLPPQQ